MCKNWICLIVLFSTWICTAQLGCPSLVSPMNLSTNSPATTNVQWTDIQDATGFRVSLGTSLLNNDILDEAVYTDTKTEQIDFPPNTTIYVTIIAFNDSETSMNCEELTFTTTLECGHRINTVSDISLCYSEVEGDNDIEIDFDTIEMELIGVQQDLVVTYHDSEGNQIDLTGLTQDANEEQFNIWARATDVFECFKETNFTLTLTRTIPADHFEDVTVCESFELPNLNPGNDYFTELNGIRMPLNEGQVFAENQTIYIVAQGGECSGETSFRITIDSSECNETELSVPYPKFFTPNGDGFNDFWQLSDVGNISINTPIFIYDRYGKLVHQFNIASPGWDGNFNGSPLPSSDYWFKATLENNQRLNGHFTLKR